MITTTIIRTSKKTVTMVRIIIKYLTVVKKSLYFLGTLHFTKELKNITRDVGRMVRMVCEVKNVHPNATNQTVKFKWYKFSAPITDERVTIARLKKNDVSFYTLHINSRLICCFSFCRKMGRMCMVPL